MLSRTSLMATIALGTLLAIPAAQSQNADTGQINRGSAHAVPSDRPSAPIPDREEIRAALMMPDPGTISAGEAPNASGKAQPETTGKGLTGAEQPGPIGSTLQTKPAKFSHRNDVIDHTPIMAMPLRLDQQQRQQVFHAVMAEGTPAGEVQNLKPADALPYALAVNTHPLPASVRDVSGLDKLDYIKSKDAVYLVTTTTATPVVVDILDGK